MGILRHTYLQQRYESDDPPILMMGVLISLIFTLKIVVVEDYFRIIQAYLNASWGPSQIQVYKDFFLFFFVSIYYNSKSNISLY